MNYYTGEPSFASTPQCSELPPILNTNNIKSHSWIHLLFTFCFLVHQEFLRNLPPWYISSFSISLFSPPPFLFKVLSSFSWAMWQPPTRAPCLHLPLPKTHFYHRECGALSLMCQSYLAAHVFKVLLVISHDIYFCGCLCGKLFSFYWSIADLQCCVNCCTAKWSSYTHTHIYIIYIYIYIYIYTHTHTHTHTHTFPFRFFSVMIYHRILNIVSWDIHNLVVHPFYI